MVRATLTYWMVQVKGAEVVGGSTFAAATLDGVFLSPTTKLASSSKGAMLESQALADEFAQALSGLISKRQGRPVELVVCEMGLTGLASRLERDRVKMAADSHEVRERLRTSCFAPNQRVGKGT